MRDWPIYIILSAVLLGLWDSSCAPSALTRGEVGYGRYLGTVHTIELPEETPVESAHIDVDFNPVGDLYWNNRIEMIATVDQVRWVSYTYALGWHFLQKKLDVEIDHYSGHCLECQNPSVSRFPTQFKGQLLWRFK